MTTVKRIGRHAFERAESLFDRVFGPEDNPLYHLGALGWFFYWIVAVSGLYLYIFFDSGVTQAYESVEYLTHTQWFAGGVTRSLHRYASDALVVVMLAHLAREYCKDRLRGARWFSWVIGTAILWLVYASGITGYWIVWDKLAQYVAIATSEWLDTLPLFGQSIARNFLHDSTLSGRFFSLMVFIHIAVPLILLFILWVHIQRIARPDVNPPLRLALGTFAALLGLSFVYPALSQGPADLSTVVAKVGLDWFYMAVFPLIDRLSGPTVWVLAGGATVVLLLLPWLPPKKTPPAVVDLENCNGCGRCAADCPYSAIMMRPRSDGSAYAQQAVVSAAKCVGCGICAGSCPTATPFRRRSALVAGIDLPRQPVAQVRQRLLEMGSVLTQRPRVLLVGCETGPALDELCDAGTGLIVLGCVGQLPPSFLDFILTGGHADGVMLAGCREGGCYHRLGIQWTGQRLDRRRDPYLRQRVPRERIASCWTGLDQVERLRRELGAFRRRLDDLPPMRTSRQPRTEPRAEET